MIIQCPQCQSRYAVPDSAIGVGGRTVRCAKCSNSWFQQPTEASAKIALDELDKMLDQINTPSKTASGKATRISNLPALNKSGMPLGQMIGAITSAAVAIVLAFTYFTPQWVGLPSSAGLMLGDIGISKQKDENNTAYQISGKIVNTTKEIRSIPILRVTLVDNDGKSLQFWDFPGDNQSVEPGKPVPFNTGDLDILLSKGTRFVVELGNPLELALRKKPSVAVPSAPAPAAAPKEENKTS